MLVRGMVDDHFGDHPQSTCMGFPDEEAEITHRPVTGMHAAVIGNVVAIVAQWRGIKRQQPDRGDSQFLDVIELLDQALEVADAIIVAVKIGLDVQLIDNGVFVPIIIIAVDHSEVVILVIRVLVIRGSRA